MDDPAPDADLEALRLRAMTIGIRSYPVVVPQLILEIMRLRRLVRDLVVQQATDDAARS